MITAVYRLCHGVPPREEAEYPHASKSVCMRSALSTILLASIYLFCSAAPAAAACEDGWIKCTSGGCAPPGGKCCPNGKAAPPGRICCSDGTTCADDHVCFKHEGKSKCLQKTSSRICVSGAICPSSNTMCLTADRKERCIERNHIYCLNSDGLSCPLGSGGCCYSPNEVMANKNGYICCPGGTICTGSATGQECK